MTTYSYVNRTQGPLLVGSVRIHHNSSVQYTVTQPALDAAIPLGLDRYIDGVLDNSPYDDPSPYAVVKYGPDGKTPVGMLVGGKLIAVTPVGQRMYSAARKLSIGKQPLDLTVLGDSTGDELNEWVYLLAQSLASGVASKYSVA